MPGLYYPHRRFISAKKCYRASWGWISVLAGHDILYERLRKQIGDGCSTRIWEDPWVPSLRLFRIRSPKPPNTTLCWVAKLKHGHSWNESLLNDLFCPVEVAARKPIQVRDLPCLNKWLWNQNSKRRVHN